MHCTLVAAVQVKPSLLHGDLWSGNLSVVEGGQVGDIRPCLLLWFVPCLAQWRSAPSVHILYTAMFILQLRESSSAPKIVCCTCHGQRKCKSRFPGRLYNMGL